MHYLKSREEFLNEGFYEWINKRPDTSEESTYSNVVFLGAALSVILFLGQMVPALFKWDIDKVPFSWVNYFLITIFLNSPSLYHKLKSLSRIMYNAARSKFLIKSVDKRLEELENVMKEDDIHLYKRLASSKIELIRALETKDAKLISKYIHEIYEVSNIMRGRVKYKHLYKKGTYETEYIQELIKKEEDLKKIDPYGEDNWREE